MTSQQQTVITKPEETAINTIESDSINLRQLAATIANDTTHTSSIPITINTQKDNQAINSPVIFITN